MLTYFVIFVSAGAAAVAIKFLGDASATRAAGFVAMLPVKIVTAWVILGASGGTVAIRDSVPGMLIGLAALAALLCTAWLASERLGVASTILLATSVWLGVAGAVHGILQRNASDGPSQAPPSPLEDE